MAKIGQLCLNQGVWNGKQLVSAPGYRRALLSIADGMNTVTVIFGGFFVKMTAELLLLLVTAEYNLCEP
jgi:hypothetical protein